MFHYIVEISLTRLFYSRTSKITHDRCVIYRAFLVIYLNNMRYLYFHNSIDCFVCNKQRKRKLKQQSLVFNYYLTLFFIYLKQEKITQSLNCRYSNVYIIDFLNYVKWLLYDLISLVTNKQISQLSSRVRRNSIYWLHY